MTATHNPPAPEKPPVLTITMGLPGCGKTTWARTEQAARIARGRPCAVVERDARRDELAYRYDTPDEERATPENAITAVQRAMVAAYLAAGIDVIVSDTHLMPDHVTVWRDVAAEAGISLAVRDFTGVDIDECVRRDAQRPPYEPGGPCSGRAVGEQVIRRMWMVHLETREAA